MDVDLSEIRKRTVSIGQYIDGLEEPFKESFVARKQTYQLQKEAVDQLKQFARS
jgi:hypothetical protein